MSQGASIAFVTSALDPRASFTVAVCPVFGPTQNLPKLASVLAKAAQNRGSRLRGNGPFYVPMLTETGENRAGHSLGSEREVVMRLLNGQVVNDPLTAQLAPNHVNRMTVGTYRNVLLWELSHMWKYPTHAVLCSGGTGCNS